MSIGELFLRDGLWFNLDGLHIYIDEAGRKNPEEAPYLALGPRLKLLLPHYPGVAEWIEENPPGGNASRWWGQLSAQMILNGWNLLWRSTLHTASSDMIVLSEALRECEDAVCRLNWPPDVEIAVRTVGADAGGVPSSVLWRELAFSAPNSGES